MFTMELVTFDATAAAGDAGGRRFRPRPHGFADLGGLATLTLFLVGFVLPLSAFARSTPAARLAGSGFEVRVLVWAAMLALLLPMLQIVLHIRRAGGSAVRSNRAGFPTMTGAADRVVRAHANLMESLPPFVTVVLSGQALHVSNRWTVASAAVYLAARGLHAASYLFGVTIVRSAAFYGGVLATVTAALQLFSR